MILGHGNMGEYARPHKILYRIMVRNINMNFVAGLPPVPFSVLRHLAVNFTDLVQYIDDKCSSYFLRLRARCSKNEQEIGKKTHEEELKRLALKMR